MSDERSILKCLPMVPSEGENAYAPRAKLPAPEWRQPTEAERGIIEAVERATTPPKG